MNRAYALLPLLIFTLLTTCAGPSDEGRAGTESPQSPNILFIAVDDLRPELGAYGRTHMHTPNIDRLAARGTVFTNAYCNVPVCGASRASIVTGMRPHRERFYDFTAQISLDAPEAVTLHGYLKENGYFTTAMGKVLHHKTDREADYSEPSFTAGVGEGFGRDYQMPESIAAAKQFNDKGLGPAFEIGTVADTVYREGKIANYAIAKLKQLAPADQPFYVAVGFHKPHLPFNAPKRYYDLYAPEDIQFPENYYRAEGTPNAIHHSFGELRNYLGVPNEKILPEAYARQLIHAYYASVSYTDAQIGRVLDALEASGEADNTIVVLWGDHGWNLGDHAMWCKHTPFNSSLRAPLIISAPGLEPGKSPAMVEFVDIFPTLCDLTGLEHPAQLQGKSLVPLLKDPGAEWTDYVLTRWKTADNITTDRYAYSEWFDDEGVRTARVLFDHHNDSLEVNNIAEDPAFESVVAELAGRLKESRESFK